MRYLYQLLNDEHGSQLTLRLGQVPGQIELTMLANDGAYATMAILADDLESQEYLRHVARWVRAELEHLRTTKANPA